MLLYKWWEQRVYLLSAWRVRLIYLLNININKWQCARICGVLTTCHFHRAFWHLLLSQSKEKRGGYLVSITSETTPTARQYKRSFACCSKRKEDSGLWSGALVIKSWVQQTTSMFLSTTQKLSLKFPEVQDSLLANFVLLIDCSRLRGWRSAAAVEDAFADWQVLRTYLAPFLFHYIFSCGRSQFWRDWIPCKART